MMDHVNAEAPAPSSVNPKVPAEFDSLVLKSLAKDPSARFQSADEFRARLENLRNTLRAKGPPAAAGSTAGLLSKAAEQDPGTVESPGATAPHLADTAVEETSHDENAAPAVPTFGITTSSGTGRRNVLLLVLGLSSLLIGVAVALLLAAAKL